MPSADAEARFELHPAGAFRMTPVELARAAWAGEYLPVESGWEREVSPAGRESSRLGLRVWHVGTATTALRPAGKADFDGELFDVVADMGVIDAGEPVRITEVSGFRIVVVAGEKDNGEAGA